MGPGEGVVLGRHSDSQYKGRMVMCGATGYVGSIPGGQSMAVWTSDDDGGSWILASSLPFKGLAECQVVELNNGSVMVNARNEIHDLAPSESHHRAVAISNDGASAGSYLANDLGGRLRALAELFDQVGRDDAVARSPRQPHRG